jgi:hypothetical protein
MEWQTVINIVAGAVLSAFGWFARELWAAVQALKEDVKRIEVDLPMSYVRKSEIESRFDRLEVILDRIMDKLDTKVDK